MSKKIMAVLCAVILMASVFSACGKKDKLYTLEIDGVEKPVVTNESGEIVTDEEGRVAVYETEANGDIVKDSQGNSKYGFTRGPSTYVHPNNLVICENFSMPVIDGWEFDTHYKKMVKNDTENKCYIKGVFAATTDEDNTFESYIDEINTQNRSMVKAINDGDLEKDGAYKAEMNDESITYSGYKAQHTSYVIYGADDKVIHYAETIYFLIGNGDIYLINYACEDGIGYDASFNFLDWTQNNVKFNEPS